MAETLNLSTPDRALVGTSVYQVIDLNFHRGIRWDVPTLAFVAVPADTTIHITLLGAGSIVREDWITGTEADALLIVLNKANMSGANSSLQKRVLDWLRTNRGLAGSVTGTADA